MGIVSAGAIVFLVLLGASPILILEVLALAAILAVGAVMLIVILGGRRRI